MTEYIISILTYENIKNMAEHGLAILLVFNIAIIVMVYFGQRTRIITFFAQNKNICPYREESEAILFEDKAEFSALRSCRSARSKS